MADSGVISGASPERSGGIGTAASPSGDEVGLKKSAIGFWGAFAMSLAAMGPLLGALGVAPLIVSQAGFSAPFIFIICWLAMALVAITIGRFSRIFPGAASLYTYISHGLGERIGFVSAWLSFSYYILFGPLLLAAIGIFGHAAARDVLDISIAWWVFPVVAAAIVFALAIIGISLSMRVDLALAVVADGVLLIIAGLIIGKVIAAGEFTLEPLAPTHAPGDFTGLSLAIAFGVLIFLGFEQCFVLGEEVEDPRGNVPKAIYVALGLVGSVLFLATFALVLGFGPDGIPRLNDLFGSEGTPWFALIGERIGTTWVHILEVMIVFSILSNMIASTNSVVRLQYGMGRAGALPRQLGNTLHERQTPYVAISLQIALALAITLICGLVWSPESLFGFLGFGIGFSAAITFILIMVAALRYFGIAQAAGSMLRNRIVPAIGAVILLPVVYTAFYPNPGAPLKWAPWVAVGWTVLGVVYLILRERRHGRIDVDYAFGRAADEIDPAQDGGRATDDPTPAA